MVIREYPGKAGAPVEAPSSFQARRDIHPQYNTRGGYRQ
jgi:hypothetical protein